MTGVWVVGIIGLVLWAGGKLAANYFENKIKNTVEDAAQMADRLIGGIDGFKATNVTKYASGGNVGGFVYVDTNSLQLCITPLGSSEYKLYSPKDILDVQIVENNSTISETKVGGQLGKAVVGGVLLGGVGAVIGGLSSNKTNSSIVDSLQVVMHLNDFNFHTIALNCLSGVGIKRNSSEYQNSMEVATSLYGLLNVFMNQKAIEQEVS